MAARKNKGIPLKISALEVVIVFLITLCVLMLVTNNVESFIRILYSPIAFLVLIIMIGEYIVLKSADRSRIYRIEVDQLRQKIIDQIKVYHRIEQTIDDLEGVVGQLERSPLKKDDQEKLARVRAQLAKIRNAIRSSP